MMKLVACAEAGDDGGLQQGGENVVHCQNIGDDSNPVYRYELASTTEILNSFLFAMASGLDAPIESTNVRFLNGKKYVDVQMKADRLSATSIVVVAHLLS